MAWKKRDAYDFYDLLEVEQEKVSTRESLNYKQYQYFSVNYAFPNLVQKTNIFERPFLHREPTKNIKHFELLNFRGISNQVNSKCK